MIYDANLKCIDVNYWCWLSVNIGGGASIELVDRFCYLRDILSIDGSANVAVMARIQSS